MEKCVDSWDCSDGLQKNRVNTNIDSLKCTGLITPACVFFINLGNWLGGILYDLLRNK